MPSVTLHRVEPARRETIANMMQLYIHDFSEWWRGQPSGELEEDGRFSPYEHLDSYWSDASREPWLIRVEGSLAGFALLNRVTHSGQPADWNMAEFFVVRKHRGGGVGTAAVHAILAGHPGQWELAIARKNLPAQSFWPRAVGAAPGVFAIEPLDLSDERWNGPVLRFRIG
ncbi:MAG TPA: GNAT family N-acetyltransferase [Caulobacteraceae bacterium]|jgi:predicted acetyltransferase|nr:GNAT family N-acetyltransferase [Caulobacteraceae bacterium]